MTDAAVRRKHRTEDPALRNELRRVLATAIDELPPDQSGGR